MNMPGFHCSSRAKNAAMTVQSVIFAHHGKYKVIMNLIAGSSFNLIKIEFGQQLITTLR